MLIEDFLVFNEYGLYCHSGDFYLDPSSPVHHAIISHAHGDHVVKWNKHIYCTEATAALIVGRHKKQLWEIAHTYRYRDTFIINGVQISFIPAGHILGSAQILLLYKGIRYLYTGDFKLQRDATCQALEFVQADVLITETTFADPAVQHPDPISEIQKLNSSEHNILLGAYALGKAQRLIQLINQHCPHRRIFVHPNIATINKVYESSGYPLGKYEYYQRKMMKDAANYVYLAPPMTFHSYDRRKNLLRVFASGWKKLQTNNDIDLLISDHADWNDILTMVQQVKPTSIWTLHGDGRQLKIYYKDQITVKLLNNLT